MREESTPGAAPREPPARDQGGVPLEPQREPLPTRIDATPPLPAAYDDALRAGLDRLAIRLDPTERAAIDGHVRLLLAWNAAINLTALRDPVAVATLHVIDSLTALAPLRARGARRLLDLGSGGGFPGIPLAIGLGAEETLLVDSVAKKARFLGTAVAAIGLDARIAVHTGRAETLAAEPAGRERWPVVTARAVAGLAELVELAFPLLETGGCLVAWKRGDLRPELAAAERALAALGGGRLETFDASLGGLLPGHRLVVATKRGRTPAGFPRDPAVRRRRPW